MLFWVIFILSISIIIVLLFTVNVKIVFDYKLNGLDDDISINFYLLREFIKYNYKLPGKKEKFQEKKERSRIDAARDKLKNLTQIITLLIQTKKFLSKKLILKEYNLDVDFGVGDAFYTGILSGVVWAIAGAFTAYAINNFETYKKHVNVKTSFMELKFKMEMHCILNIKIVYIIVVGIKLYIYSLKSKLKAKNKSKKKKVVN